MAHVGRFYKLLHRRDICLGCRNYRFAFPEAFSLDFDLLSNNPENLRWRRQNLICPAIDPPQTHRPRWESADLFDNSVSYRCTIEFDGYTPLQQLTNMIVRFHTGSHYWLQVYPAQILAGRCNAYRYDTFGQGSLNVLDPVIFGGNIGTGQLSLAAATWQQYP